MTSPARSIARRAVVACVACVVLAVLGTLAVLTFTGRRVAAGIPADALRGLMAGPAGEACRAATTPWVFTTPIGGEVGFFDRATLVATGPSTLHPDPALVALLGPHPSQLSQIYLAPGGGSFVATLAESGPCSLYFARWPSLPGVRPAAVLSLLAVVVLGAAVAGFFAIRYVTRPTVRRLEAVAEMARHVGDRAPPGGQADELAVVDEALAWAHQRISADRSVLAERARALEAHLADLSHDLRTPMTALFMRLEALASDPEASPGVREQASDALADTVYLSALTENRRLESALAHAPVAPSEPFSWAELAERVARRYRLVSRGRGVRVEVDVAAGLGAEGEASLAEQALGNLVQNAVMYGGQTVRIQGRAIPSGFSLMVSDDGPGVPPDELGRLGTRHYRGETARQRAPFGSGLGLAIARAVAQRHGWELTFSNREPTGLSAQLTGERSKSPPAGRLGALALLVFALAPALLAAAPASAQGPRASADWHRTTMGVEALTSFPVHVGARVWLDAPYGVRVATGLGVMPGGYLDVINEVMVESGQYSETSAQLIRSTLESALFWSTQVGWRWPDVGLVVEVGYGLAALGGGLTGEEVLAAGSGRAPPSSATGRAEYEAESLTHLVSAEVGWMGYFLDDQLTVRATVGVSAVVASAVKVTPAFEVRPAARASVDAFVAYSEGYLEAQLETVVTPTLNVAFGWRFF